MALSSCTGDPDPIDAGVEDGDEIESGDGDGDGAGDGSDAGPDEAPDGGSSPDGGDGDGDGDGDAPTGDGPFQTTTFVDDYVSERGDRATPWNAYVPDGAGPFPVVIFVPGFQVSSTAYASLLQQIASWGFVVVRADPPASLFSVDHVEMSLDVSALLDHVGTTLSAYIDPSNVAVMGHSLGGKIAVMAAFRDDRVKAVFAIDPVNGAGPSGYSATRPDIVPDEVSPLTIPLGFVGETTNSVDGGLFSPACAPLEQNFMTFFDSSTSSSGVYAWDFIGADHMDFVSDPADCGLACGACTEGTLDVALALAQTQTLAVAFLQLTLLGDTLAEQHLLAGSQPTFVVVDTAP